MSEFVEKMKEIDFFFHTVNGRFQNIPSKGMNARNQSKDNVRQEERGDIFVRNHLWYALGSHFLCYPDEYWLKNISEYGTNPQNPNPFFS